MTWGNAAVAARSEALRVLHITPNFAPRQESWGWARSSPPRSSATSAPCPASPAGITSPPITAPRRSRCPPRAGRACRLSRRGNRRHGHAIHMAAVTQIRYRHTKGRACYDKKLAEGKTPKEALRALKRQISDAIFACLQEDARRAAAAAAKSPGGQPGNHSATRAAGSHPDHRLFGQATPGPATHPTTTAPFPAPLPSRASEGPGPGPGAARPRSGARRASSRRPPASR